MKEEVKLSLFPDDMILLIKDYKNSIKNFYKQTPSNMVGHRIYLHKSITFLYANHKHVEEKIIDTYPFTRISKIAKYLGINLMRGVKDHYNENFKPFKK